MSILSDRVSYLLFLDESGHDHKAAPYEVTGGVAVRVSKLWPLVQQMQRLELDVYGVRLAEYSIELKGSSLLARNKFKWAKQGPVFPDEARRKLCRTFLTKGLEHKTPTRDEFTAYGQACLRMAAGIFELLRQMDAQLFAAAIPATVTKPQTYEAEEYLRKDHVFLLERFFYFLERRRNTESWFLMLLIEVPIFASSGASKGISLELGRASIVPHGSCLYPFSFLLK